MGVATFMSHAVAPPSEEGARLCAVRWGNSPRPHSAAEGRLVGHRSATVSSDRCRTCAHTASLPVQEHAVGPADIPCCEPRRYREHAASPHVRERLAPQPWRVRLLLSGQPSCASGGETEQHQDAGAQMGGGRQGNHRPIAIGAVNAVHAGLRKGNADPACLPFARQGRRS